jgi:RNA polymerase primary sigma factor
MAGDGYSGAGVVVMGKRPLPRPAGREHGIPSTLSALLEEAGRHRLLTRAEEIQLARRIEGGDRSARDRLVLANLRLVVSLARRYWLPPGSSLTRIDLVHEGVVGLIRAAELFDWRAGARFSTYASFWIRQAIARALALNGVIRLPQGVQRQIWQIGTAERELRARLGREPTDEEVARELSLSIGELTETRRRTAVLSLDEPHEAGATLADAVPSDRDAELEVERNITERALREHVASLPERLRDILILHYGLAGDAPLSLAKIGTQFGLSRERVRQLKTQALTELRHRARHEQPTRSVANRLRALDPLSWLAAMKVALLGSTASTVTTGVLVASATVAPGTTDLPALPGLAPKATAALSERDDATVPGHHRPTKHRTGGVVAGAVTGNRSAPASQHKQPRATRSSTRPATNGAPVHMQDVIGETPSATYDGQMHVLPYPSETSSGDLSALDENAHAIAPAAAPNNAGTPPNGPWANLGMQANGHAHLEPGPPPEHGPLPEHGPPPEHGPDPHSNPAVRTDVPTDPPTGPDPTFGTAPPPHSNALVGPPSEAGPPPDRDHSAHANGSANGPPAKAGPPADRSAA